MTRRIALAVSVALLVAGCGGSSSKTSTHAGGLVLPSRNDDGAELADSSWVLSEPHSGAATPTIEFRGSTVSGKGTVNGTGGCNSYSGAYSVAGEKLTIHSVVSTQMACVGAAMTVEQHFFAALSKVAGWRISDGYLTLSDSSGKLLLHFAKPSLAGSWIATSLLHNDAIRSVEDGTKITADFAADGTLTGSAGCNSYRTNYTLTGSELTVDAAIAATKLACTKPQGVMEQEHAFLAALPKAHSFRLEHGGLTLLTAAGTIVATFKSAG